MTAQSHTHALSADRPDDIDPLDGPSSKGPDRMTPREKRWVIYDVGNSAFVLLSTAIVPIYANSLLHAAGKTNIVSTWGYTQTIASLVIALLMPILGSIADVQGMKIRFFIGFFGTGVIATCALALPLGWLAFFIVYIVAVIGLNGSLTFYDSMLIDTTTDERMDKVSSHGFGWGYIGSTIPFILCIALIFAGPHLLGWSTAACTRASFLITALWWAAFTMPLLTSYRQVHFRITADHMHEALSGALHEISGTFRTILRTKSLWMFMLAFFFYIDAVNTVISMSTSYGTQLGIDATQLVIALLVTQFVAFPCSIAYGRLARRFGAKPMIVVGVVAYLCIVLFAAFFLKSALEFWILAISVGVFQGGIQALSRSYYGRLIPKEHANEYYGFYDIFGKTASILGSFIVAIVTSMTGDALLGVLSIGILLVAALAVLLLQRDPTRQ